MPLSGRWESPLSSSSMLPLWISNGTTTGVFFVQCCCQRSTSNNACFPRIYESTDGQLRGSLFTPVLAFFPNSLVTLSQLLQLSIREVLNIDHLVVCFID